MKLPILGSQTLIQESNDKMMSFKEFLGESTGDKPRYTGRYIVSLTTDKNFDNLEKVFKRELGLSVANTKDFGADLITESSMEDVDIFIYDELKVALVSGEMDKIQVLEENQNGYVIEPEKVVYIPEDIVSANNSTSTWGMDITEADLSKFTGTEINVAVLDTGCDLNHPDFVGRHITSKSFVPNEHVQDLHGHGTHCVGTACGDADHNNLRYGVANNSNIFVGKVLNNSGSGAQSWILNGIDWAVKNKCNVISMSLGSSVFPGEGYDMAYERAAQYALSNNCLIVAAAGNDSNRKWGQYKPVSSPANCPSIIGVAAIDSNLNVANFSNRTINPTGKVDISAPGVKVYSSWPMPERYKTISGTSMATPIVAGIIALLMEKYPNASHDQIANQLRIIAQRLPLPNIDVGVGLSMSP